MTLVFSAILRKFNLCLLGLFIMDKSKLFILFMVSFLAGIFAAALVKDAMMPEFVAFIFGTMVLVARHWCGLKWTFWLAVLFVFGFWRFFYSFEINGDLLASYGREVSFEACIVEESDVRVDKVKYTVESDASYGFGRVLVYGDRYPVYEYGDCLNISGELARPDNFSGFDYGKYLARYEIYAVVYRARMEKIESDGGSGGGAMQNLFFEFIYNFKSDIEGRLQSLFSEPYSSFLSGLLLGSRRGIPVELTEDFNTTGLSHIVAISGYNITLVILAVGFIFNFLGRRKKVFMSVLFIVVFVVMVGMSAAVVRSAIMGIIGLLAIWFGRQYAVTVALIASAFFMNLWNPKILVYDIGFQLSFMATAGIIFFRPILEKYFVKWPGFLGIKETLLMTLSAQILATPIILLNFQRFSLIAPVANIFVLPFIPLVMIFGFAAILLSYFFGFFAGIFGFIAYLLLKLMIFFVEFFADIPLASLDIGWFGWWWAGIYYWMVWKILKSLT